MSKKKRNTPTFAPSLNPSSSNQPSHSVVTAQTWVGPLPPPNALEAYEKILPGAADRILAMAEANNELIMSKKRRP